jgi:hypothetical protein
VEEKVKEIKKKIYVYSQKKINVLVNSSQFVKPNILLASQNISFLWENLMHLWYIRF